MLNELENACHPKNPMNFFDGCYSIEHIMPQNALAHDEWVNALGGTEAAASAHSTWVHRLGNLTVTAYNSELSDGTFEDKKSRMVGGYENDVISISADVVSLETWDATAIEARGNKLAKKALEVWAKPKTDPELVAMLSEKPKRSLAEGVRAESFAGLFARGAIASGDKLVHSGVNGIVTAEVTENGKICLQNGEVFNSPSMAAIRAVALLGGTGNTRNGWKYWNIQRGGESVQLSTLREVGVDSDGKPGGVKDLRRAFWNGFYEYVSDLQDFCDVFGDFSTRKENADSWCSIGIGKAKVHLDASVYFDPYWARIGVDAWFYDIDYYGTYYARKDELESILEGLDAKWDDPVCDKKSRKVVAENMTDPNDYDSWPDAYEWMVGALWKFKAAFGS